MALHIFVNGYGAPKNPIEDGNFDRYLGQILQFLEDAAKNPNNWPILLYLAGGYTNSADLTEAAAMQMWLRKNDLPLEAIIQRIERSTTARENLLAFRRKVGDRADRRCIIFCEFSRRRTTRFFAGKLWKKSKWEVIGVKFDARSLRMRHRLFQLFWRLPLEIASWHIPAVDRWIRKPLRTRLMARSRRETR